MEDNYLSKVKAIVEKKKKEFNSLLDQIKYTEKELHIRDFLLEAVSDVSKNTHTETDEKEGIDKGEIKNKIIEYARCGLLGIEIQPYYRLFAEIVSKQGVSSPKIPENALEIFTELMVIEEPCIRKSVFNEMAEDILGISFDDETLGLFDSICSDLWDGIQKDNPKKMGSALSSMMELAREVISALSSIGGKDLSIIEKEVFQSIPNLHTIPELKTDSIEKFKNVFMCEQEQEFGLPPDLFTNQQYGYDSEAQLFELASFMNDPGKVVKLVNYLARESYIANDTLTKSNVAYRLTGRYKPNHVLNTIEWNGDVYSLLGICHLIFQEKKKTGKWIKIHNIFEYKDKNKQILHDLSSKTHRPPEKDKSFILHELKK